VLQKVIIMISPLGLSRTYHSTSYCWNTRFLVLASHGSIFRLILLATEDKLWLSWIISRMVTVYRNFNH